MVMMEECAGNVGGMIQRMGHTGITSSTYINMTMVMGIARNMSTRKIKPVILEQRAHSEYLLASSVLPRELDLRV